VRIIARKTLREFWESHSDARQPLQAWYSDVKNADWKKPSDIKGIYRNASFIANNRVVFNIKHRFSQSDNRHANIRICIGII